MAKPSKHPFDPYLWFRAKFPEHLRKPQDFYFVSFAISGLVWLVFLAPWLMSIGYWLSGVSSAICAVVVAITLIMWRLGVPLVWPHMIFQGALLGVILYNASQLGGVTSSTMVWLAIVPVLPFFVMERKIWSHMWLLVAAASVWGLYFLQRQGWVATLYGQTNEDLLMGATMFSMICMTQNTLVATYDAANRQWMRYITRKNVQLRALSSDLELANEHKDKFLAMVSHDMRTPLNAVIGYVGLLQDDKRLPPEALTYVHGAHNAASHLLAVINDLLDFSQIRMGKLALNPQVVQLPQVLTHAFQTLQNQAHEMGLGYTMSLDPSVPTWARVDQNRLAQMLINLLGNAIKFTPKGHVRLHIGYEVTPSTGSGRLVIRVEDTGIGIEPDVQARIFQPFVQVYSPEDALRMPEPMRGNGLGLAITQSLVRTLQGELSVQSVPGQGSVFTLTLPLEVTAAPKSQENQPTQHEPADDLPIRLLVIDDNDVNRLVASNTLKRFFVNAQIDQAANGTDGLHKMSHQVYDLVLIDLVMPDIDGAEVVRRVRTECLPPYRDVPAIALTANLAEDARIACEEAGMNAILPKPFDRHTLVRSVRHYAIHPAKPMPNND